MLIASWVFFLCSCLAILGSLVCIVMHLAWVGTRKGHRFHHVVCLVWQLFVCLPINCVFTFLWCNVKDTGGNQFWDMLLASVVVGLGSSVIVGAYYFARKATLNK